MVLGLGRGLAEVVAVQRYRVLLLPLLLALAVAKAEVGAE